MLQLRSKFSKEKTEVPNIKSAIKRVKVNQTKNEENRAIKSRIATYIKKFKVALSNNEIESAENLLKEVVSYLDSAASNNVIHKNNASRKQAHLSKLLDDAKKQK